MSKPRRITELTIELTPEESDLLAIVSDGETKRISYGTLREAILDKVATIQGWARYDDATYTTASAFTLTTAMGDVTFPNSGSVIIDEHIHSTIPFYDTGSQKIQVENEGDTYMCTVVFKAKAANANSTYIRLQLDSTGLTPYSRVGKDLTFPRGNDTWHDFHEVFQWYADTDFVNNGNRWKVQAVGSTVDIADIVYFIQRIQNHRAI